MSSDRGNDDLSGSMMTGFSVDSEFDHRETEGYEQPKIGWIKKILLFFKKIF